MKNIVDIILITSKFSSVSKKFERKIRKEQLDFIKIVTADTPEIRKLLSKHVKHVPCIIVVYDNEGDLEYDTFEAGDAEEWLEELLQNRKEEQKLIEREKAKEIVIEPAKEIVKEIVKEPVKETPAKNYSYINLDDSVPQEQPVVAEQPRAPVPEHQNTSRANNAKSVDLLSKAREMEKMRQQEFNKKPVI